MSNRKLSHEAFLKMRREQAGRLKAANPDWYPGVKFFSFASYQNRAKRRARWEHNRNVRATHNASFVGQVPAAKIGEYHTMLNALSAGTA